ncbi:hypothetical protein NKH14_28710 [Mesorhizobium sp. M1380]|uniref:hypothetical protein n=1 Tax=Mesorhizobium sp. M1380 TaxID=2957093 RepID=UPI0033376B17
MKIDKRTISAMNSAGIGFMATISVPGGGQTVFLNPSDIEPFLSDREKFAAQLLGVSKTQYMDWVKADGAPQCGATTKRGTRCGNFVSGGGQRPIDEWIRLEGGYCAVHGGEGSER